MLDVLGLSRMISLDAMSDRDYRRFAVEGGFLNFIVPREDEEGRIDQAYRAISTGQLHTLPHFNLQPINVVVYHGSQRDLVSRGASRLDAFSGYPVRT